MTPTLQITGSLTLKAWVKIPRKAETDHANTSDQAILGNYDPTLDVTYFKCPRSQSDSAGRSGIQHDVWRCARTTAIH